MNKLTADFDDDVNLAFGFGESCHWLVHVPGISDDADGLLGELKLAEVEMCLEILEAPDEMVLNILWVEDARFVPCADPKEPPEASSFMTVSYCGPLS